MTIVLTGGGTAGHCLPCVALLPELKKRFDKIVYMGSFTGIEKEIIVGLGDDTMQYFGITSVKLRRSLTLKNLAIPFKLLKGIRQSKLILKQIRPDVVFSKGGFVALPVVIAASKLGIPVVAHESDMTMGLANKLTVKRCDVICTTFPMTAAKYKNAVHTGAIIRKELYTGRAVKLPHDKINLLVMGGSLGSAAINGAIYSCLDELLSDYNIMHITGRGKGRPDIKKDGYTQLEYVTEPQNAFAWADVVVSRAGSGVLCELIALRKPALFIPLPRAESRGDQIDNALFAVSRGVCSVLRQEDLTAAGLLQSIKETIGNKNQIIANCNKLNWVDGTDKVVQIISSAAMKPLSPSCESNASCDKRLTEIS
jgi:UDP-N-acetylglucosamine--N-acetylmuramyl-(pentapeptide) pyrophosphoryl-undecaprenol N-acetylglucosamine transferase